MPRISKPLTDKEIKLLKPKEKIYKKGDGGGLYIFIEPSGRKYFALEYKSPIDKKIKRTNLGVYPEFTLAMAREERFKTQNKVRDGVDIKLEKIVDENSNFESLALRWLDIKAASVSADYIEKQKQLLNLHIFPKLRNKDIRSITTFEIIDVLKKVEKHGKYETVSRLFMLLNQIYKSAFFITPNIMQNINYRYTFKTSKKVHYPAFTKLEDIKRLMISINEYSGDIKTKFALKFIMLTALRPYNVRHASWSEINFKDETMEIGIEKMKTKEPFCLPLAKQSIELLKELENYKFQGEYIFPSYTSKTRVMSENTLNTALRRMGYSKDEMVSHGFRSIFSTIANENTHLHGQHYDVIERCLAHKERNEVRASYNRANYINQMRILIQWWADFLDNLD